MRKNAKMAVVLSALVALTISFAGCGKNDSSSSTASSSSAASTESTAAPAESTAAPEESTAAPAESAAAPEESKAEGDDAGTEVDTAALTGNTWITAQMIKEDGSNLDMDAYAAELGTTTENIISQLAFTADGKFYMISLQGSTQGTYAINGKKITVTPDGGTAFDLEMGDSDGTKMLGQEINPPQGGYKGAVFGINPNVSVEDIVSKFSGGEQGAEGGEQAAEGGEEAAEGGEEAAEGGEEAAEGGEEAAEGGEEAAEGGEEAAE